MKPNRVCDLLGIDAPVLQGGMLWLASAELAAAVCNAGALGILSAYAGMADGADPVENLRLQIRRMRELTSKPFGINVPLDLPEAGLLLDAALRDGVRVAVTAAGSPAHYTEWLRSSGVRVLHVVSSVSQAVFSASCGADAVIAEGTEAGGKLGREELSLMSLVPQVRDAVSCPVIAAGGIVDGRGLAAAFALGAEGVQLGTRFVATEECPAHPRYKQAILEARDTGTIVTRRAGVPTRSLREGFAREVSVLEKSGAPAESIRTFVGRGRSRKAQLDGNLSDGDAYAGSSAGMIREILPVAAVVESLIEAYRELPH